MASFAYDNALEFMLKGDLDFDEAGNSIKALLCLTNTTCDTLRTAATNAAFTLDEATGGSYARQSLTQTVSEDNTNHRGVFDAVDITFTAVPTQARNVQGCLVYKYVDDAGADIPLFWIEFASSFPANGSDIVVQFNAAGVAYLAA